MWKLRRHLHNRFVSGVTHVVYRIHNRDKVYCTVGKLWQAQPSRPHLSFESCIRRIWQDPWSLPWRWKLEANIADIRKVSGYRKINNICVFSWERPRSIKKAYVSIMKMLPNFTYKLPYCCNFFKIPNSEGCFGRNLQDKYEHNPPWRGWYHNKFHLVEICHHFHTFYLEASRNYAHRLPASTCNGRSKSWSAHPL